MKTLAEYERNLSFKQEKQGLPPVELSAPEPSPRKGGGILKKIEYVLVHPERPRNGTVVWEKAFEIEGQLYPVICENGIVTTREETLKDFFIKQGWMLEKTITEGNS